MNISEVQDNNSGGESTRKLYTGVENFYPIALNPTMKELQDMGIPATEEPVYYGKMKLDSEGGIEVDYFNVRIFLDNRNATNNIKTQVSYTILKRHKLSTTNKYLVINNYGNTTWLEEDHISDFTKIPSNMEWYVTDGVRKAYIGEDNVIDFIKALRNLPNINNTAEENIKKKGVACFTDKDFDKIFKADFKDLRKVIIDDSKECKLGFLLGIRSTDNGNRQGLYSRMPLKSYIKSSNNTDYLIKKVKDSQDAGSFSNVIFDLEDTVLKEYDPDQMKELVTPEDDDLPF